MTMKSSSALWAALAAFCVWLLRPMAVGRMALLDISTVGAWGGTGGEQPGLPAAWRGLFYLQGNMQPDGSTSPLIGMDTTLCAFDQSDQSLSCPSTSMFWAAERPDSALNARRLATARFRYEFRFDPKYDAAQMRALVFGIDVLPRIDLVWDIAKLGDGKLKRCSWAASSAEAYGATPLERIRNSPRSSRSCYMLQRAALDGRISSKIVAELKRTWGGMVARFI